MLLGLFGTNFGDVECNIFQSRKEQYFEISANFWPSVPELQCPRSCPCQRNYSSAVEAENSRPSINPHQQNSLVSWNHTLWIANQHFWGNDNSRVFHRPTRRSCLCSLERNHGVYWTRFINACTYSVCPKFHRLLAWFKRVVDILVTRSAASRKGFYIKKYIYETNILPIPDATEV